MSIQKARQALEEISKDTMSLIRENIELRNRLAGVGVPPVVNLPERIWVDADGGECGPIRTCDDDVEYVRADLYDALKREYDELRWMMDGLEK